MDFPLSVSSFRKGPYLDPSLMYTATKRVSHEVTTYSEGGTILGNMVGSTKMEIAASDRQGDDYQPEYSMSAGVGWGKPHDKEVIALNITGRASRVGKNTDGEVEALTVGTNTEILDSVTNVDTFGVYGGVSFAKIAGRSGVSVSMEAGWARKYVQFRGGTGVTGDGLSLLLKFNTETLLYSGDSQSASIITQMEYEQMPSKNGIIGAGNLEGRIGFKTTIPSMDLKKLIGQTE